MKWVTLFLLVVPFYTALVTLMAGHRSEGGVKGVAVGGSLITLGLAFVVAVPQLGDADRVAIVEVRARREDLDDVKAVRLDRLEVRPVQALAVKQVRGKAEGHFSSSTCRPRISPSRLKRGYLCSVSRAYFSVRGMY